MSKKKPSYYERSKQEKEQPINKKALIWIGAAFVAIVVIMATLMILDIG